MARWYEPRVCSFSSPYNLTEDATKYETKDATKDETKHEAKDETKDTEGTRADLNHRRLGHLGFRSVKRLEQGLVKGLVSRSSSDDTPCAICARAKSTRNPFPSHRHRRQAPLELVHSDVAGPLPVRARGGFRYTIVYVDDATGYICSGLLKRKSEQPALFVKFHRKVTALHDRPLQVLRTDNGTEYQNNAMATYCAEHGISQQFTVPHSPAQNGVAERANRTLWDMTRALMLESGVPPHFWGFAFLHATYIRNHCPTAGLDRVPRQLWEANSGVPNLQRLRVFGCTAYAHILVRGAKFDPRSKLCVHLGFDHQRKAYRLFDPAKRVV